MSRMSTTTWTGMANRTQMLQHRPSLTRTCGGWNAAQPWGWRRQTSLGALHWTHHGPAPRLPDGLRPIQPRPAQPGEGCGRPVQVPRGALGTAATAGDSGGRSDVHTGSSQETRRTTGAPAVWGTCTCRHRASARYRACRGMHSLISRGGVLSPRAVRQQGRGLRPLAAVNAGG